jgi:hypothetical protein
MLKFGISNVLAKSDNLGLIESLPALIQNSCIIHQSSPVIQAPLQPVLHCLLQIA